MTVGTSRFWIAALAVLFALAVKALLVSSWVAAEVEDAVVDALSAEGLAEVDFVEVDGVPGIGGDGIDVVLRGPEADRDAAIAAVRAREEIADVVYRPIDGDASAAVDSSDRDAVGIGETKGRQS